MQQASNLGQDDTQANMCCFSAFTCERSNGKNLLLQNKTYIIKTQSLCSLLCCSTNGNRAHTNGSNQYHSYAVEPVFCFLFLHLASFHISPTAFPTCLEGHFLSFNDVCVMMKSKGPYVWEVLGIASSF